MKELLIKEKAKAYDGLIERLKDLKFAYRFSPLSDTIEEKFPELKESEDERIRKKLIELFHDTVSNDEIFSDYGLDKTEVLAWFEKQGDKPQGKSALEAIKEEKVDNRNYIKSIDKVEPKFHEGEWITIKE